ncbi:MAG: MBL fold metallo-hydrolase [Planctomycetota bacterium]|jgi:glyoxylase-like metal-dependent hydrolase (beta-lactamase superfamily II)
MSSVDYCIVSIGTLSRNRLWGEGAAVRTAHATTTSIRDAKRSVLVDPSLPSTALAARFNERTGQMLDGVTDVFCTTLRPVHRRSIEALPQAKWWVAAKELEIYRNYLRKLAESSSRLTGEQEADVVADLKLLERFHPAPEKFTKQIHLYPLPGASPGSAGLLLTPPASTVVIAGDAVVTAEHLLRGQVWQGCFDTQAAISSLQDVLEIADVIIPGHDNLMICPRRWL